MGRVPRRWAWPLSVVATAVVIFVMVWFQPHKLFIDDMVDQALPDVGSTGLHDEAVRDTGAAGAGAQTERQTSGDGREAEADDQPQAVDAPEATDSVADERPQTAPDDPVDLAGGTFGSLGRYTTSGQLRIVELPDGTRIVRFEDFATDNGPDLLVYLSTGEADGSTGFTDDFVDLGVLHGNIGDQNYEVPDDVDLDRYTSAVIYCKRFSAPFGAAEILPVA